MIMILYKIIIIVFHTSYWMRDCFACQEMVLDLLGGWRLQHYLSTAGDNDLMLSLLTSNLQAEEVIKAADMFFYSEAVDVIIVAGDLNSSPHSPVYNIFTSRGFADTLVSRHGDNCDQYHHHTWGNTANTWSRPGGPQSDGYSTRLDYVFYKLMPHYGQVRSVDVVEHETVDPKIYKQSGNIFFSLSDHSLVETTIRLKF